MKTRWVLIAVLGVFFLLADRICQADGFENIPKMTVRGEASVFKPADQMEVALGVVTSSDTSAEALEINKEHIRQIISNLKQLGLDQNDYQTGSFRIRPIYQKPSKDSTEQDHGKISHYEALSTIQIKTHKIILADQIINAAVKGGANQITKVNFNLNNPQAYRAEAIKLAAHHALSDATALAEAAGVSLKRILDLSLDHWFQNPQPYLMKGRMQGRNAVSIGNLDLSEEEVSFEPGQTEIHASVNLTIEMG